MSKQSPRPLVERADAGFGRYVRPGSNSAFLLGGRTSASAECRHWSGRAVRWSSCAIAAVVHNAALIRSLKMTGRTVQKFPLSDGYLI